MSRESYGWDKLDEGFKIDKKLKDKIQFFKDPSSRNKRIHIKLVTDETSLCNNSELFTQHCIEIPQITPPVKKALCKNYARILMTMNPDDTRDQTVKTALNTLSRKPKSKTKHNRLDRFAKALDRTPEDMLADMEDAAKKAAASTITLPDEIGPEEYSLTTALASTNPAVTVLKKAAIMNLDRVLAEWKQLAPENPNSFGLIQRACQLKELIQAIDKIKGFPKQP